MQHQRLDTRFGVTRPTIKGAEVRRKSRRKIRRSSIKISAAEASHKRHRISAPIVTIRTYLLSATKVKEQCPRRRRSEIVMMPASQSRIHPHHPINTMLPSLSAMYGQRTPTATALEMAAIHRQGPPRLVESISSWVHLPVPSE